MGGITQQRALNFFNVVDKGADPTGTSDSTAAIANTRAAARAAGGGVVFYPPGTYTSGNQDISTDVNVYHLGSGIGATVIKLKNGANTDLFSAQTNLINPSASGGSGVLGTLYNFGWSRMTLDGNKTNQFTSTTQWTTQYEDTFGSNSSASYYNYTGTSHWTWDTTNHRLIGDGSYPAFLFYPGTQTLNGSVSATIDYADNYPAVVLGYIDHNNYYSLTINDNSSSAHPNTVYISRWVNGAETVLTSITTLPFTFTRGVQHVFVFQRSGNVLTATADGTTVLTYTDASPLTKPGYFAVRVGFVNPSVRVYDFKVTAPGPCYPLRFYGPCYFMNEVLVENGFSGNMLTDWNGGSSTPSGTFQNVLRNCDFTGSGGIGVLFAGAHDTIFENCIFFQDAYETMVLGPNALSSQFANCHWWGAGPGFPSLIVEGQADFTNCQAESSDTAQIVLAVNGVTWVGGRIYGGEYSNTIGVQFGQGAGDTPYPGQTLQSNGVCTDVYPSHCQVYSRFSGLTHVNGGLWLYKNGGHNDFRLIVDAGSGTAYTGGLSADNLTVVSQGVSPTNGGFASFAGGVQIAEAATIYSGSGAPSNTLGSNGDFYFRTDTPGTANQRLYTKSAGAWVGIV